MLQQDVAVCKPFLLSVVAEEILFFCSNSKILTIFCIKKHHQHVYQNTTFITKQLGISYITELQQHLLTY